MFESLAIRVSETKAFLIEGRDFCVNRIGGRVKRQEYDIKDIRLRVLVQSTRGVKHLKGFAGI